MAKKTGKYTVDELIDMLVEQMGNPFEAEITQAELVDVISQWGLVDGSNELLHAMMGRDILLYWQGKSDLERENVRGGFARTAWIRGIMKKANELRALNNAKKDREAK
jgi:hypothetical protein